MYVVFSHLVDNHCSVMEIRKIYFQLLFSSRRIYLCLISKLYIVEVIIDVGI